MDVQHRHTINATAARDKEGRGPRNGEKEKNRDKKSAVLHNSSEVETKIR